MTARLRERLDPRLHSAAAIGWAVFGVVTLAALIAAKLAAGEAEQRARADAEGMLAEFATQVRDAVALNLETRRSLLQATAAQVAAQMTAAPDQDPPGVRRALEAVQAQFPEFVWLGVADASGRIVAATGDQQLGADASGLMWFQQGLIAPFFSDQHAAWTGPRGMGVQGVQGPRGAPRPGPTASAAASSTAALPPERQARLIDAAVPVRSGGVLGAALSWRWVEQQVARMQGALNRNRRVDLMLAARDGGVLAGPEAWLGRSLGPELDASEGGQYVIGSRARLRLADGLGLGWTAIVRQQADLALAPVRTTRRSVFLIVFAAGLLAAAAAALVTRWLMRRLARLAVEAEAVRRGERRSLAVPAGADEVSRIGATLAQLVDQLQAEKQALQDLNVQLDQRVADRTLRIERLADEARHAAVTRERLRIARDLHDTLAHSLMALLTQIRLVRKLRGRLDDAALDAELAHAESAASTGLTDARAAITQMRDKGVRDGGLGPALQDLVRRLRERTGLSVTLLADDAAAKATDERAETVFRIVEEALRNVERHAAAQQVQVSLQGVARDELPSALRVEVLDDGIGFDPALPRPGHFGLLGIREQAALIGATLGVHSAPGQGTRIALELPA